VSTDPAPHALAAIYLAAVVTVEIDGQWMSAEEAVVGVGEDLHVITAWNPGPLRLSRDVNRSRNRDLRMRLEKHSSRLYPALGADPGSEYAEESWGTSGLSDETALAIAREFDQVAIFRLAPHEQIVLGCQNGWRVSRQYSS